MDILNKISVSDRINAKPLVGDIGAPINGDIWYNSSLNKFRKYENGMASDLDTGGSGGTTYTGTSPIVVTGSVISVNEASASQSGVVNTIAQTFAGDKTINGSFVVNDGNGSMSFGESYANIASYNPNTLVNTFLEVSSFEERVTSNFTGYGSTHVIEANVSGVDISTNNFGRTKIQGFLELTGLPINTTDNILYYNSSSKRISYGAVPAGGSGITRSINNVSVNTTAASAALTDYVYFVTGTVSITLPTAVENTNRYSIKNVGTGIVTIVGTIDGGTNAIITKQNNSLEFISNNTNWQIF